MRVLVVGCGYVGLPLGAELARQGHQVFGLRRTGSGQKQMRAAGITPLQRDITKAEELASLRGEYDWVIDCVATSGGGPREYQSVYLQGGRNLLNWLSSAPPKKFLFTSSTSVYGQTDGSLVDETSRTEPATETAMILVETERIFLEAARQTAFPAIILRVAGIYGPGRGYWLKQFLKGHAKIEGAGERFLNMIQQDDVVGSIIAALQDGRAGEVYNAVDDGPVTQLDFFKWLSNALGRPLPPFAPADEPQKRGFSSKQVSNAKLKRELGYTFKYPNFKLGYTREIARCEA